MTKKHTRPPSNPTAPAKAAPNPPRPDFLARDLWEAVTRDHEAFLNEASDTVPCLAEPPPGPTDVDARAIHERLDSLFAQTRSGVLGVNAALALACEAGWSWARRFDGAALPGRPR